MSALRWLTSLPWPGRRPASRESSKSQATLADRLLGEVFAQNAWLRKRIERQEDVIISSNWAALSSEDDRKRNAHIALRKIESDGRLADAEAEEAARRVPIEDLV